MSDIENVEHQGQQQEQTLLYTRDDVAKILKEFDRQREEQRESIYRGIQLPEQIREILDETPTADLKDDIKRFKRNVPKYNHNEWTRTPQINKEFINELKKWKVDTHQVVTSIIKHAEEARFQARTSTEIFEILESIEGKCTLEGEESRQLFFNAMAQASRAAVCGFAHARDLDQEAKEYSTKVLRLPASLRYMEQEEDNRKPNLFDNDFVKDLHDVRFNQRILSGAANYNNRGRGFSHRGNGRGTRPFYKSQFGHFQPRRRGRGTFGPSTINQQFTNNYTDNTTSHQ
ncbi:hypothetical protein RO3G_16684 [Rhizopus delemar RA 99-880]|uniref:Uncharacterized protein n=1 Tax=Rhizopus delemar (strain RA 99-880 / ATCC MYA-4621 / FGSC 9543 / NRRL 43880) TaxID=246409 RepID=I1CU43_RHIO9|nr:hypothetical protein RO3G_16684 [Rhizopus delemar RA 99-880]KAG1158364.1 hypothetical protein G6F36_014170 [Rhizopus arrhizus]|eukprot:EIE91973.1 hypothetical protein RO3G_16684 [Rhizopus delemar RA 99-880]